MTIRDQLDDLLEHVPAHVTADPVEVWRRARVRRLRRRTVLAAVVVLVAASGVALGVGRGVPDIEPAPSPGAAFERVEQHGKEWTVVYSDGTAATLDLHEQDEAPVALSPDGRWIAYTKERTDNAGWRDLFILGVGEHEPVFAADVPAYQPYSWGPDSRSVLVSVVDGDLDLVDTAGRVVGNPSGPGHPVGFVDDSTLAWISGGGNDPVHLVTTDLHGEHRQTRLLDLESVLDPGAGETDLSLQTASLSPDGERVAILYANDVGDAPVFVLSTRDGRVLDRAAGTVDELATWCPIRWVDDKPVVATRANGCVIDVP